MEIILGHRRVLALLQLLVCFFVVIAKGQDVSPKSAKIVVLLSAERTRLHPGEDIPLRVEIKNEGSQSVFIAKDIETNVSNAITKLDLDLYYDKKVDTPMTATAADSFSGQRVKYPPLASELSQYWIALPPGHFYGGTVVMRASSFKQLRVPGTYQIKGRYSSRGFLAPDINNPLLHYAEELKNLPYGVWTGEIETSSVQIKVLNH